MAKDSKDLIVEDGVYYETDSAIGRKVDEFARKGYRFKTEEGLDLCRTHTLDDKRVRSVLEFFFPRSGLGLYKAFGAVPNRVFLFGNNIKDQIDTPPLIVIVQLFGSGSQMTYYKSSHTESLDAKPASIGLLEAAPARLRRSGIKPVVVDMKEGGLVILDSRCAFTIERGVAITFAFSTTEEVAGWAEMDLPDQQTLRHKAAGMSSDTIAVNFVFSAQGQE